MKYILITLAVLLVCIGLARISVRLIGKRKQLKRGTLIVLTVVFSLLLMVIATLIYMSIYYPADTPLETDNGEVKISTVKGGFFFDGPGEEAALVFYPGAKVETVAYASLMSELAENGIDCYLADMPFHFAVFGSNMADDFMESHEYNTWIAAGHSLGGVIVSDYALKHSDVFDAVVLLASYPQKEIPDSISLCSIYGTEDGCLNHEAYENAKALWPANAAEYVLEGGNHAGYANYGPQSGDGVATITREEQQRLTAEFIVKSVFNE